MIYIFRRITVKDEENGLVIFFFLNAKFKFKLIGYVMSSFEQIKLNITFFLWIRET